VSRRRLAGLVAAVLLAGCQGPPSAAVAPASADPTAAALAAVERRDWAQAAPLLRRALERSPADRRLHYHLAVSASYLDALAETEREFVWVVEHFPANTDEAKAAQKWLEQARAAGSARTEAPPAAAPADEFAGTSGLSGQATFAAPGETPTPRQRLQLHLMGLPDTPVKDVRYVLRTDEEGRFAFKNIRAGSYKLTDRVAGPPTWRLRVTVEDGREARLDLTPANALRARDDFPR
jgi:hypothetical protein